MRAHLRKLRCVWYKEGISFLTNFLKKNHIGCTKIYFTVLKRPCWRGRTQSPLIILQNVVSTQKWPNLSRQISWIEALHFNRCLTHKNCSEDFLVWRLRAQSIQFSSTGTDAIQPQDKIKKIFSNVEKASMTAPYCRIQHVSHWYSRIGAGKLDMIRSLMVCQT